MMVPIQAPIMLATVTPFDTDGALHTEAMTAHANLLAEHGVYGVAWPGWMGEGHRLNEEQFTQGIAWLAGLEGMQRAGAVVRPTRDSAVAVAGMYKAVKNLDFLLVSVPTDGGLPEGDLCGYLHEVSQVSGQDLVLYLRDDFTDIDPHAILDLRQDLGGRFIGVKDSRGNAMSEQDYSILLRELAVWQGNDRLELESLLNGLRADHQLGDRSKGVRILSGGANSPAIALMLSQIYNDVAQAVAQDPQEPTYTRAFRRAEETMIYLKGAVFPWIGFHTGRGVAEQSFFKAAASQHTDMPTRLTPADTALIQNAEQTVYRQAQSYAGR